MLAVRHEFQFQTDRGLVEVRAFGKATLEGFVGLDTKLVEHSCWTPGMRVMFDLRALDLSDLSVEDIHRNADFVRGLSDRLGTARFACVMAKEIDFGLARMFEVLTSEGNQLDIRVFRSMSEAETWLGL